MTAEQPERRPYYITVKLMIWSTSEEEARELAVEMMEGNEIIPSGGWYLQ
jgi:hypothetical protein